MISGLETNSIRASGAGRFKVAIFGRCLLRILFASSGNKNCFDSVFFRLSLFIGKCFLAMSSAGTKFCPNPITASLTLAEIRKDLASNS